MHDAWMHGCVSRGDGWWLVGVRSLVHFSPIYEPFIQINLQTRRHRVHHPGRQGPPGLFPFNEGHHGPTGDRGLRLGARGHPEGGGPDGPEVGSTCFLLRVVLRPSFLAWSPFKQFLPQNHMYKCHPTSQILPKRLVLVPMDPKTFKADVHIMYVRPYICVRLVE